MLQPVQFGKYLLLYRITVVGMAEVFAAKAFGAEGFERILAIKKILPTMGEDPELVSMFVDEARIAVQLSHPNIVQVLELGKHDETLYIAMEYISGRDLRQLLDRFRRRGRRVRRPRLRAPQGGRLGHAAGDRPPGRLPAERAGELRRRGEAHRFRHRQGGAAAAEDAVGDLEGQVQLHEPRAVALRAPRPP